MPRSDNDPAWLEQIERTARVRGDMVHIKYDDYEKLVGTLRKMGQSNEPEEVRTAYAEGW